jgi:hypothetical protein
LCHFFSFIVCCTYFSLCSNIYSYNSGYVLCVWCVVVYMVFRMCFGGVVCGVIFLATETRGKTAPGRGSGSRSPPVRLLVRLLTRRITTCHSGAISQPKHNYALPPSTLYSTRCRSTSSTVVVYHTLPGPLTQLVLRYTNPKLKLTCWQLLQQKGALRCPRL